MIDPFHIGVGVGAVAVALNLALFVSAGVWVSAIAVAVCAFILVDLCRFEVECREAEARIEAWRKRRRGE